MNQLQDRIAQFRKMANDDPENELGHFRLGQLLMEAGQHEEAVRSFQRTLELSPQFSKVYQLLGTCLLKEDKRDEALKIARANVKLLPASYNLAAIYAQNGQPEKALAFLKRHFYQYERYQSVRTKEMMEARVDAVFDSLRSDPAFLALTRDADGRLQMPMGLRSDANK